MEPITTDPTEVLACFELLAARLGDGDEPGYALAVLRSFERHALGVPSCPAGRDRFEIVASCGCLARWVYEHDDEPGRGFVGCACGGWIDEAASAAELVPCDDEHATELRRHLDTLEAEAFDGLVNLW